MAQQGLGEAGIADLVGHGEVAIIDRRLVHAEADMEHQLKAGHLGADSGIG
ncbi:hypothetical protein D3C87_2073050 [compost metagenome]